MAKRLTELKRQRHRVPRELLVIRPAQYRRIMIRMMPVTVLEVKVGRLLEQ
ncbi:MAG: hypothetical protein ACLP5H_24660 [Desulfomonilaceae bacterium]